MIKYAILFTKENVNEIAAQVDHYTAEEILRDYGYMLDNPHGTVLFMDQISSGVKVVGGVNYLTYFKRNNPGIELNDKTFTEYYRF